MTFSNRSNDMGLRVASLDYLGVVAAHLRRNTILCHEQDQEDLLAIISEVVNTCHVNLLTSKIIFTLIVSFRL